MSNTEQEEELRDLVVKEVSIQEEKLKAYINDHLIATMESMDTLRQSDPLDMTSRMSRNSMTTRPHHHSIMHHSTTAGSLLQQSTQPNTADDMKDGSQKTLYDSTRKQRSVSFSKNISSSIVLPSKDDKKSFIRYSSVISRRNKNDSSIDYADEGENLHLSGLNYDEHSLDEEIIGEEIVGDDEIIEFKLTQDTYSMMMISSPSKLCWWCSLFVCLLQLTLFVMIFHEQATSNGTIFNVPATIKPTVLFGEFLATLVLFTIQDDIIDAIRVSSIFLSLRGDHKRELNFMNIQNILSHGDLQVYEEDISSKTMKAYWKVNNWQILFPNALKFINGVMALIASFLIVVSSESLIDLFKDFSALSLISNVDNICFKLSKQELFGAKAAKETESVEGVVLRRYRLKNGQISSQSIIYIVMALVLYSLWAVFINMQLSGDIFHKIYPKCFPPTDKPEFEYIKRIGDGTCDRWANSLECEYDGGDCVNFNLEYPKCDIAFPEKIADGNCDKEYLTIECGFDGLDCCDIKDRSILGDHVCHYEEEGYNTLECGYDNFDCIDTEHPDCRFNDNPSIIHNGECNMDYNTAECGWDGGDCCQVTISSLLGNGKCDGKEYNTPECFYDRGDCLVTGYGDCHVDDVDLVGNGICEYYDSEIGYNTPECGYDRGDCDIAVLQNGIYTLKVHREGYIDDDINEFDRYSLSAKRISDSSGFWAGDKPPFIDASQTELLTKFTDEPSEYLPLSRNGVNEATSTMIIGNNRLKLTHTYKASSDTDKISLFEAVITYENMSNDTYSDLRYREEINWRDPLTSTSKECVSLLIKPTAIPGALEYSNLANLEDLRDATVRSALGSGYKNFSSWNLRDKINRVPISIDSTLKDSVEVFQFLLKNQDGSLKYLGPRETASFDILYGNVPEMKDMREALSLSFAEIAGYGYIPGTSSCNSTANLKSPTFFIGFRGVNGKQPLFPRNIEVSYYVAALDWLKLPSTGFANLSPFKTGTVETIDFSPLEGETFIHSGLVNFVAALFEGFLLFPLHTEATVEFCLTANDGAKMYNNGLLIIDNDGLHRERTVCGQMNGTGLMKINLEYFQMAGKATFRLEWKPPGTSKMTVVPSSAWIPMKNVKVKYYDVNGLNWNSLPPSGLANSEIPSFKFDKVGTINFPNNYFAFGGSGLEDYVAAMIVGYIQFRYNGEYSFCLSSDDGSKLYIDDVLIIDNDGSHDIVKKCKKVFSVKKGSIKKITVEYFDLTGGAALILEWTEPGGEENIVPSTAWIPEYALA